MVGSVFGEFFAFAPSAFDKTTLTQQEAAAIVGKVYGENTQKALAAFAKAYPGKNPTDLLALDRVMRRPSKKLAAMHARGRKAGAYLYNFTLEFPIARKIAWHCADIPFFFHNTDKVEVCSIPGVTEKLEGQIFGAFMRFARTGVPGHENLPPWPAVTPEDEPTMIFDRECEIRSNYDDELLNLIDSVLPPFDLMAMMAEMNIQH